MVTEVNVGGTWRDVAQPSVKVGGAWKKCGAVHIKVGGTWKEVWAGVLLGPLWDISNHIPNILSVCSVTFETDGSISVARNGGGDTLPASDNWWMANPQANVGANYEVAMTAVTGAFDQGPGLNVWTSISSAVKYQVQVLTINSPDTSSATNVTFEIRLVGGSTIDSITGCNHVATN